MPREGLEDELARWREAGLLTAGQARAIAGFERGREGRGEAASRGGGITVVEVLAYLGSVVALAGILILLGTRYEQLGPAGRLGILSLVTAASAAGAHLLGRGTGSPAARRARAAALALADIGLVALVFQVQVEPLGGSPSTIGRPDGNRIVLSSVLVGTVGAAGLLFWTRATLMTLLLSLGVYLTGLAFLAFHGFPSSPWGVEAVFAVCGAVLAVAAEVGRLSRWRWWPELLAFASLVVPSLLAYILPRPGEDLALELLGGVLALLGFGIAALRSSPGYAVAGAIGTFGFVLEVELRHFQQSLGFALILIISGLALLGIAYLTARLVPRLAGGRGSKPMEEAL